MNLSNLSIYPIGSIYLLIEPSIRMGMLHFYQADKRMQQKLETHGNRGQPLAVFVHDGCVKLRRSRGCFAPFAVKVFRRWHEPSEHANIAIRPAAIRRNIR